MATNFFAFNDFMLVTVQRCEICTLEGDMIKN